MSNSAISTVYIADPETYNPTPFIIVDDEHDVADFYIMGLVLHDAFDDAKLSVKFISNQSGEILSENFIDFPDNKASDEEFSKTFSVTQMAVPDILHLPIHVSNVQLGKTYSYTVKLFENGVETSNSTCAVSLVPKQGEERNE